MKYFFVAALGGCFIGALANAESVKVTCQSGNCFLRAHQSAWNLPIEAGKTIQAATDDTVMGIGGGTNLEIEFADGTKAYLKNTGLLKINKGALRSVLVQGTEAGQGAFKKDGSVARDANLVYVGTMAIKFLSPPIDTPIIVTKFPYRMNAVFRVDSAGDAVADDDLKQWKFYDSTETNRANWRTVSFSKTGNTGKDFSAEIEISKPGDYRIAPAASAESAPAGFAIIVKGQEALESEIQNLLQQAAENPDAKFELRSN